MIRSDVIDFCADDWAKLRREPLSLRYTLLVHLLSEEVKTQLTKVGVSTCTSARERRAS